MGTSTRTHRSKGETNKIPPETFEEICSGRLGFREARRDYGIGHARYKKIQQGAETPPSVVPPHISFRKTGEDTDGEILGALRDVFQGRPELFLSREEYKVLEGTPKTAEKFTPLSIYGTSLGSSANSVDSNTTTSLPAGTYKTSWICECTQGTRPALQPSNGFW